MHFGAELLANDGSLHIAHRLWGTVEPTGSALIEMDFLVEAVEDPFEVHPGADGPVDRERTDAQYAFQFIQKFQRVLGGAIALVDEGENRDATSTADFKELLGLRLNALGGIDDHHHSIDGSEHAVGVFREILVPGGVQQIDGKALVFELENGGADGDAALAF